MASSSFGRAEILEWWLNCKVFERTPDTFRDPSYINAVNNASAAGFVQVLDWWRNSGLPISYTSTALEQASSKGMIASLEWWKQASRHQGGYHIEGSENGPSSHRGRHPSPASRKPGTPDDTESLVPLRLKVGKSIVFATQNGREDVVRWWDESGIPYAHEDTVAKLASQNGHVEILQLWKELKGEKMIYDNQVLVGPTKHGHRDVLEWWKNSGLRVEYKTCDIEEAMEDSLGGEGEKEVREWWANNGLNLGGSTREWMKVKVL
jgi:hypothetical protein